MAILMVICVRREKMLRTVGLRVARGREKNETAHLARAEKLLGMRVHEGTTLDTKVSCRRSGHVRIKRNILDKMAQSFRWISVWRIFHTSWF